MVRLICLLNFFKSFDLANAGSLIPEYAMNELDWQPLVPSIVPSLIPTVPPSKIPTARPSPRPSLTPTRTPSSTPSYLPSSHPTNVPSYKPSSVPSTLPTYLPTFPPTTALPTSNPSSRPSVSPSSQPTTSPTIIPTSMPSTLPTAEPSIQPTALPTTASPTSEPTNTPTALPTTLTPTAEPTLTPTSAPTSATPTISPTINVLDALCDMRLQDQARTWTCFQGFSVKGRRARCSWQGVTCDQNHHITIVDTTSFVHTNFTIPTSISFLTSVRALNFKSSSAVGMIPSSIGSLSELMYWNSASNNLVGSLPSTIGAMSSLTVFYSQNNEHVGTIPSSIGRMSLLQELWLFGNRLTGTIPTSMCYLSNVRGLLLHNNSIHGSIPTCMNSLTSLTSLNLRGNSLIGSIPALYTQNMISVDVSGNWLTSVLPTSFCSLSLISLNLAGNRIRGTVPSCLGSNSLLSALDLSGNSLTGSLPSSLCSSSSLTSLLLGGNSFNCYAFCLQSILGKYKLSSVPYCPGPTLIPTKSPVSRSPLLVSLSPVSSSQPSQSPTTSMTKNTGYLCDFVGSTSGSLTAYGWNCTRGGPATPCDDTSGRFLGVTCSAVMTTQSSQVTDINLSQMVLTGSLPSTIGSMQSLQRLAVTSSTLSGILPEGIGSLSALVYLNLKSSNFRGYLPTALCKLTALTYLSLQGNNFIGKVPTCLGSLSLLKYLFLGYNSFTGSLPSSLGAASSLKAIDLRGNWLLGSVPSALRSLSFLEIMSLDNNQFSGTFPTAICGIKKLEALTLKSNQFACFPSCESNPVKNIPRCPDQQDVALYNLKPLANLQLTMNASLTSTSFVIESSHPFNYNLTSSLVSVPNAVKYNIVISPISDMCYSILNICRDAACHEVIGRFQGTNAANVYYGGIGVNSYSITVTNSSFYVGVVANQAMDLSHCPVVMGYKLFVSAKNHYSIGWGFEVDSNGVVQGTGLCSDTVWWAGITCDNGLVTELVFTGASLSGTLPTSIGFLSGLTTLDLGNNLLTGPLPTALAQLTNLVNLRLAGNRFTGCIPSSFALLSSLVTLDLSYNSLACKLPTFLSSMSSLHRVILDSNKFIGQVPSIYCSKGLAVSLLSNPSLACYQYCSSTMNILNYDPTLQVCSPTVFPTGQPTGSPSGQPTSLPTKRFTSRPTVLPTFSPTRPTLFPSRSPTVQPTKYPSVSPTLEPTAVPTQEPTTLPTSKPSKQVVVYQASPPLLTTGGITGVSFTAGLLVILAVLFVVYKQCFSAAALAKKRRKMRLKQLPIHSSLLVPRGIDLQTLAKIIEENISSAGEKDADGNTALDIILHKKCTTAVNKDIYYRLMLEALPFDAKTLQVIDDSNHTYGWMHAVQSNDPIVLECVELLLSQYRGEVATLAYCTDSVGRRAIDIADPKCKDAMFRKLYLHERFELKEGPPEHCSATSMVIIAKDHYMRLKALKRSENHDKPQPLVAIKYMKFRDQYLKEVQSRRLGQFDERYVIPLTMDFDGDSDASEDRSFREDSILKDYGEYPYCIVMEAGTQSLKHIIDHERVAAVDWNSIQEITRSLAKCLDHIHSKGIVHCDLKPLNVLQVGRNWKLIDLDASANYMERELTGFKCSSGYIPPEMLCMDVNGEISVRGTAEGDDCDLIFADPSQDMWALGCIVYLLSTAHTLFHVNTEDNVSSDADYMALYKWDTEVVNKKLAAIKDKLAKNLVSLLLNKEPSKRPSANRVLCHPFLTGHSVSRLQGEQATFDVFLSYRVSSESKLVEMLYNILVAKGLKVWWDKKCLLPGQNWEAGFCKGLVSSGNFVALVSRNAIKNENNDRQNFDKLSPHSPCDNVLLEWQLALELHERGMIEGIFPVLVGDVEANGTYKRLRSDELRLHYDVLVTSVEAKLREHLDREGLGLPYREHATVKATMSALLANQGAYIMGDLGSSLDATAQTILDMVKKAGPKPLNDNAKAKARLLFKNAFKTYREDKLSASLQASKREIYHLKRELEIVMKSTTAEPSIVKHGDLSCI